MTGSAYDWSPTAANNTAAPPNGWPGGMYGSQVEPTGRQMMASVADLSRSIAAGGTSDAITATLPNVPSALVDGMEIRVRASAANTTTTPTLNLNSLGADTITKLGGAALVAGDIAGDLHELLLRYNAANTRWELLNPGSSVSGPASSATGNLPIFSGTSGKVLSDGGYKVGTAPNNVLQLNSGGQIPNGLIPNSGVTAGNYTAATIIVGADGRVTSASSGSYQAPLGYTPAHADDGFYWQQVWSGSTTGSINCRSNWGDGIYLGVGANGSGAVIITMDGVADTYGGSVANPPPTIQPGSVLAGNSGGYALTGIYKLAKS